MSYNEKEPLKPDHINRPPYLPFYRPHNHRYNFQPWYDDRADYNTNAKSYYDYLARWGANEEWEISLINRLLRRNIEVDDTNTVDMTKIGDWIDNGTCSTTMPPNNFDDVIHLKSDVILSKFVDSITLNNVSNAPIEVPNAIIARDDGLFAPDYTGALRAMDVKIGELETIINEQGDEIENLTNKIQQIENAIQKIIDNLYNSGAITTNNYNTFEFVQEGNVPVNIAYGNINVFGGTADGSRYIKTRKVGDNDDQSITAGV